MILPADSILELKRKCKRNKEANESYKVMTLIETIKILDKLGGVLRARAGLTFCLHF
jgi:hypothetical protein